MDPSVERDRGAWARDVDAVVVGGGHAGIEAAWALGKLGHSVALITIDARGLGRMSCNPSIGGLAKGQLVREIDALGGLMGRLADRAGIHFRMLNRRKGPAVHAPRAQMDKPAYTGEALARLLGLPGVQIVEAEVTEIVTESAPGVPRRVSGVRLCAPDWRRVTPGGAHSEGPACAPVQGAHPRGRRDAHPHEISTRVVILALGTFLEGVLFTGMDPRPGGRRGEPPADALGAALRGLGLRLGRLKTGTPPRLARDSIDLSVLEAQPGDEPSPRFSFFEPCSVRNRVLCHLTRTNPGTHRIVAAALDRSPLYGGMIQGIGPRHCPSIEDKVVRFPERGHHQVFLEPEGIASDLVYPSGISTSLPQDVQQAYVRTIRGLEHAGIVYPGYAIEYSFLLTSQIETTLRVRGVEGLYAAGQINGTSGYEEAAAQGLVAGLNARAWLEKRPPVILRRGQAYIGVLIDDLITKTPTEPYRMFTSQSEYRLMLRQDNADQRLSALGHELGLLGEDEWRAAQERRGRIENARRQLESTKLDRAAVARAAAGGSGAAARSRDWPGVDAADVGRTLAELLRRPETSVDDLLALGLLGALSPEDRATLEADVKYDGYISRLLKEIEQRRGLEDQIIPVGLLDEPPEALSREAREHLWERRPLTLGQASRIPGVTPCDLSILAIRIRAPRRVGTERPSGDPTPLGAKLAT